MQLATRRCLVSCTAEAKPRCSPASPWQTSTRPPRCARTPTAAYCAVKAIAEQIVLDANEPALTTVSIRPRFVWGPGSILIDGLVAAAEAGQFGWIGGGRYLTDVTYVDNAVEGFMLGWQRGRPGQAYFVTDQHRVILREFLETLFRIYGVDTVIADMDAPTAAAAGMPLLLQWVLGQSCTLRTDKAVSELGYQPIVCQAAGLDAVRKSVAPEWVNAVGEHR